MNVRTIKTAIFGIVLLVAAGCSASKDTAEVRKPRAGTVALPEEPKERDREKALKHFIDGALYDSKGDFPKAALEYQQALQYDHDPAIFYALSKDYAILEKHALAAQAAQEAIRLDSTNLSYRENLAAIYQNAFQKDKAILEYEKILRIDSNYVNAWYNLARLYQADQPLKAIEVYERMLDREGDSWELLLQIADLNAALGRFDQAAEYYKRLLEIDPSNRAFQRQLAETYGRAGNFDEAVRILKDMLETHDDPEVTAALADIYLGKQEFEKALNLYELLLEKERDNPEIKMRVGIAYFGQIQTDTTFLPKARMVFEDLAKSISGDWRPFWYLGAIADMEGKDSVSLAFFERVTEMGGGTVEAWVSVAARYFDNNQHQKVVEMMDRAKKLFPRDFRVYLLLGLSHSRLGNTDAAIEDLRFSLSLNPNDVNAMGALALTLDGLKHFSESDSLYERALELEPNSHLVLNNYSYSLAERGIQLERALRMAQEAVSADSGNASYLDTLGWIFYKLENYSEAERYIQKAIDQGDASPAVHEHLGDVYFRLAQKDKALHYWQKALEMNPQNRGLREKIERGTL